MWEPATTQVLFSLRAPHATPRSPATTAAALSPCGALLATAGADCAVRLWSCDDGALLSCLVGHSAPPSLLCWAPDGRALASGGGDDPPRVWAVPAVDAGPQAG